METAVAKDSKAAKKAMGRGGRPQTGQGLGEHPHLQWEMEVQDSSFLMGKSGCGWGELWKQADCHRKSGCELYLSDAIFMD